eukprot:187891-Rhodomonas_salina.1
MSRLMDPGRHWHRDASIRSQGPHIPGQDSCLFGTDRRRASGSGSQHPNHGHSSVTLGWLLLSTLTPLCVIHHKCQDRSQKRATGTRPLEMEADVRHPWTRKGAAEDDPRPAKCGSMLSVSNLTLQCRFCRGATRVQHTSCWPDSAARRLSGGKSRATHAAKSSDCKTPPCRSASPA